MKFSKYIPTICAPRQKLLFQPVFYLDFLSITNEITGHISCRFVNLLDKYSAKVAASFYGYLHHDSVKLAPALGRATSVGYIGPSLAPTGTNPSMRVYR